jgi:hypothetical protein
VSSKYLPARIAGFDQGWDTGMEPSRRSWTILLAFVVLASCKNEGEPEFPAADEATISSIEAVAAAAEHPAFTTSETIDGASYGLVGDGRTVNTAAFQSLMARGDRTIRIPAGDYVTSSFSIGKNTILILEPGTIIRDSGELPEEDRLIYIMEDNVHISGAGAQVIADRADYQSGEQRHGVFIYGAHNVVIDGLEASGHGGDGFHIGGMPGDPATNIVIKGCRAENNRRQGLSIISARRAYILDCEFVRTRGTAPQFGVDLEPDWSYEVLDQIVLLRPQTMHNEGGGIMILLEHLDASSTPIDITIVDHFSQGEGPSLSAADFRSVPGTIRYNRIN